MHLSMITVFLATLALAAPAKYRDQLKTRNEKLVCFYLTTERDWRGEGINLCETPGKCGRLSIRASSTGEQKLTGLQPVLCLMDYRKMSARPALTLERLVICTGELFRRGHAVFVMEADSEPQRAGLRWPGVSANLVSRPSRPALDQVRWVGNELEVQHRLIYDVPAQICFLRRRYIRVGHDRSRASIT